MGPWNSPQTNVLCYFYPHIVYQNDYTQERGYCSQCDYTFNVLVVSIVANRVYRLYGYSSGGGGGVTVRGRGLIVAKMVRMWVVVRGGPIVCPGFRPGHFDAANNQRTHRRPHRTYIGVHGAHEGVEPFRGGSNSLPRQRSKMNI